jgi:hypothetical protein
VSCHPGLDRAEPLQVRVRVRRLGVEPVLLLNEEVVDQLGLMPLWMSSC